MPPLATSLGQPLRRTTTGSQANSDPFLASSRERAVFQPISLWIWLDAAFANENSLLGYGHFTRSLHGPNPHKASSAPSSGGIKV